MSAPVMCRRCAQDNNRFCQQIKQCRVCQEFTRGCCQRCSVRPDEKGAK